MNVRILTLLCCCIVASSLGGCVVPLTRSVQDVYTKTTEDTTIVVAARHEPGDPSNGALYPAPRVIERHRSVTQYDSVVRKDYPAFIRAGLFESAGFLGSGSPGIGAGLFGVYYNPADLLASSIVPASNPTFSGALYRVGILEYRLRWFRDAPDWTLGTSVYEALIPKADDASVLSGILPLYVRKRYYLRREIPYVCLTPAVGLGFFPSQYLNLGTSLDAGSMAGFNMRAYVGYATGITTTPGRRGAASTTTSSSFPYIGLGVSLLDFLNSVPDTETEWKDQPHSGWDVGLLKMTFLNSALDSSYFGGALPISGFHLQALPVSIALPIADKRLYAGTELFTLVVPGSVTQQLGTRTATLVALGLGILPLRVGYWQPVLRDELTVEPFLEYSYYPSSMTHIGARLNLLMTPLLNVGLTVGYISSSGLDTSGEFFRNTFGNGIGAFSTAYAGVTIGLIDRIFLEQQLRYFSKGTSP